MSKLDFNYSSLCTSVLFNVSSTIDKLTILERYNDNIHIPSDFSRSQSLRNYFETVKSIRNNYVKQYNFVIESNKKIGETISELNDNLLEVKKFEIKNRDNII